MSTTPSDLKGDGTQNTFASKVGAINTSSYGEHVQQVACLRLHHKQFKNCASDAYPLMKVGVASKEVAYVEIFTINDAVQHQCKKRKAGRG